MKNADLDRYSAGDRSPKGDFSLLILGRCALRLYCAMIHRLAFMTLGILKQPVGHPDVQGFIDRLTDVYAAAETSPGFVARSIRDVKTWEHSWGPVVRPTCTPPDLPRERYAMTLSLWESLEAVVAYSYRGLHNEALAKRADWFVRGSWPAYVAWWVPEHHVPRWSEGTARIDHLHAHGSTAHAFTFKEPFNADNVRVTLDRSRMPQAARLV